MRAETKHTWTRRTAFDVRWSCLLGAFRAQTWPLAAHALASIGIDPSSWIGNLSFRESRSLSLSVLFIEESQLSIVISIQLSHLLDL